MACRLAGLSRSAYRRPLKGDTVADPDRALRDWLRAWAKKHPRYGYRRAYHDARGEGWAVNHKKIQRLWRAEGSASRSGDAASVSDPRPSTPRRRSHRTSYGRWTSSSTPTSGAARSRSAPSSTSTPANASAGSWSGRSPPTGSPPTSKSSSPSAVHRVCSAATTGPSSSATRWPTGRYRTGLFYIPPGSPWHNGYVESFNSRLRDECLNINSFYSLLHAQVVIGDWKTEYNHQRRHSSLGYLPPAEYARQCTHQIETDDSQSDRTE